MLTRIALCSVEWQYPLLFKPRSIGGKGDSLNSPFELKCSWLHYYGRFQVFMPRKKIKLRASVVI